MGAGELVQEHFRRVERGEQFAGLHARVESQWNDRFAVAAADANTVAVVQVEVPGTD